MKRRVARSVLAAIRAEITNCEYKVSKAAAADLADKLYDALTSVGTVPGGRFPELPSNFYRILMKPYYLCYRLHESGDHIAVYLLRHSKQKPLSPNEHEDLADEAEDDSIEY